MELLVSSPLEHFPDGVRLSSAAPNIALEKGMKINTTEHDSHYFQY